MVISIILAVAGLVIGGGLGYVAVNTAMKAKVARKLKEAEDQGENMKRNKLLEAKEKFLNMKAEFEKEVAERNSKIQQSENRAQQIENRAQQKEQQVNQKQKELDRKNNEVEAIRENLEKQLTLVDAKQTELDKLNLEATEKLSAIAGLSVEEAKNQLVESIKDEAKTEAMAYVNEMMEDAKLTANKEAKRIIVQTIQRVATETAIENSVTVFNIESDEVKGRIIGREGRNIRALEAATGVEIIVDDTPEAIVLSGFDPVRREIARLALHQLVVDGRIHPSVNAQLLTLVATVFILHAFALLVK